MTLSGYQTYKRTESGRVAKIPDHWTDSRLKDVLAAPVTDGPHTTPQFLSEGIPFLSVDAIQDGELVLDGCRFISAEDHADFRRKAAPRPGDLLMGKAASTGKIARVKTAVEFSIWSPLALIRIDENRASPSYIEYVLKSPSVQAEIDNYCTANTQKNIGMVDIPKLRVVRPPLAEQRQIADFLDRHTAKIDLLIEKQARLIETLAERRQAVIGHAVTKGLDPNAPMKESGYQWVGQIPVHWDSAPFVRLTTGRVDYRGATPTKTVEGIQLITARNVKKGYIDRESSREFVAEADYDAVMRRGLPEIGDVLLTMEAPLGNVALVDDVRVAFAQRVIKFRLDRQRLVPEFVNYLLNGFQFQQQILSKATGSTALGLKASKLIELFVGVPPMSEQALIVQMLDASTARIDALSLKAREMIDVLKERRRALISAAVTGKIDVRGLT